jgi:hypothetical protein
MPDRGARFGESHSLAQLRHLIVSVENHPKLGSKAPQSVDFCKGLKGSQKYDF